MFSLLARTLTIGMLCTTGLLSSVVWGVEKPNVLLICIDDLKPVLACYGDRVAKSPNIDRLASRGVLFENAYCNQAVCSPSRNALLTGLRPQTLGIYDLPTNFRKAAPDAVTLPQTFKQNGYHTESLGKIFHVGHGNTDDAVSWSAEHWRPKIRTYASSENEPNADSKAGKNGKDPKGAPYESADVPDNTFHDGAVADEAIARLKAAKARPDQPFFLAVGFIRPHLPFVAPKKYWDMYDPQSISLAPFQQAPEGAPEYAPQFGGELRSYRGIPASGPVPEDQQRTLIHGYYAATSYTDTQIGRVLDALDSLQLDKNTIIVLWGDHGWHLGDHGMWAKHTNYEQATHIPFLVVAPGAQKNARTTALVESVDVYPTLCELAGLKVPTKFDGKSFAATLRDVKQPTKEYIQHVYPRSTPDKGQVIGRSIRNARYRLVEWKAPGKPSDTADIELYDYQADPLEKKNIATEKPDVVAQMRSILAGLPEAKPQWKDSAAAGDKNPATNAKPKQDRNAMFDKRDENKDGKLSRDEFLKNQPDPDKAPDRFSKFDADKSGDLSRNEYVDSGSKK